MKIGLKVNNSEFSTYPSYSKCLNKVYKISQRSAGPVRILPSADKGMVI